jgi:uncharacterized repeat protein (TIGR03803 family)
MACVVFLFCAVVTSADAQTFTTLAAFDWTDGSLPRDGFLAQGVGGNLYGTTLGGVSTPYCQGCGSAFEITTGGSLTTGYAFCSQPNCSDGSAPFSNMVQASDGDLYGTTTEGGANGKGTVFRLTASGAPTTIYSFCSQANCADGYSPDAELVEAADGTFYGTTYSGGANQECSGGCGTIFRVTPEGTLTTVYSFCSLPGCADGNSPFAGVIQGRDGNLYGTTYYTGENAGGTVFKVTPGGVLTILSSSCQGECGSGYWSLIQAANGDFYGTTLLGGTDLGWGTVFKTTSAGGLTTLHNFEDIDGGSPAGLVQATDGNLYGTTIGGGNLKCGEGGGCGTIFKMTASGTLTTLHKFDGIDGDYPYAVPMQATDGNLYGTTSSGLEQSGTQYGTVFSLSTGLAPFVQTLPTSRRIGGHVSILGNNLTDSTSVSFNGTPAEFTVASDTEITTTVPAGATTGFVTVTTPSGVLTSNKPFQVIP